MRATDKPREPTAVSRYKGVPRSRVEPRSRVDGNEELPWSEVEGATRAG